jgi:tetratricopeptide (TPR) repeat protein
MVTVAMANNPRDALDRCAAFLDADPDNPQLLARAIDLSLEVGEIQRGMQWVGRALSTLPSDPYFIYRRGCLELAAGDAAEGERTFRSLVERVSEPEPRVRLAYCLLAQGKYAEAKRELELILGHADRLPEIRSLYLRALHYLGEVDAAIAYAEAQLEKDPRQAPVLAALSTLYVDADKMVQAKEAARKSMDLGVEAPDALVTMGTAALGEEDVEQATGYFRRALEKNPRSGRAWVGQGLAQMLGLDLAAAEASLAAGVQNMPTHVGSWHALAWCQILRQDTVAAEASLTRALELDRNFAETHGGLAVVAAMQGQVETAKERIRRALGLNDECFSARFAQSLLLRRGGREQAAGQLVRTILGSMQTGDGRNLVQVLAKFQVRKPPRS